MDFKGTKGEWKHDKSDVYSESEDEFMVGNIICTAPEGFESSMVNWEVNAKLIEKAPVMFDELVKIMETYDKGTETYLRVMKLLTKITE